MCLAQVLLTSNYLLYSLPKNEKEEEENPGFSPALPSTTLFGPWHLYSLNEQQVP